MSLIGQKPGAAPATQQLGDMAFQNAKGLVLRPRAGATPHQPGDMVFELVSDTILKIKYRGLDGVVRDAITLNVGATSTQVSLTGNQTVAGVKTFSSAPLVPALGSGDQVGRVSEVAPAGLVGAFACNTAPAGWLKANGALVSRTTYAALFAAIGTTFGAGDGSTTFAVPDLRGEFVRGWDDARGVDSGRAFGSAQADGVKQSTVDIRRGNNIPTGKSPTGEFAYAENGGTGGTVTLGFTQGAFSHTPDLLTIGAATETRPRNVALLACIKF